MDMKYRSLFLTTAALALLCACSSDGLTDDGSQQSQLPISLQSRLTGAQTRGALDDDASLKRLQSTQIAEGEKVYAWVEDNNGTASTAYINAWQLEANGDGSFLATTQYYPATGDNVDIYCIHGNFGTILSGTFPTAGLSHTVAANQSSEVAYLKSDLLYGSVQNQGRRTSQPVVFKHKLTKIEVKLKVGDGVTAPELANGSSTITILGMKNVATYTPARSAALADGGDIATYGGTVVASGTATDIQMYMQKETDATATIAVFGEAIIVPQTVSSTASFLKIHTASGGDMFAKLGGTADKVFEAGKKYVYTVTVSLSGITLSSSISDWADGTGDDINADIDP